MKLYVKGFITGLVLFLFYILLTGAVFSEKNNPYNSNKRPGRYQYTQGVDWRKNDISTWVDTQNGIAIINYIDSKNEEQIKISTYLDLLESAKENVQIK